MVFFNCPLRATDGKTVRSWVSSDNSQIVNSIRNLNQGFDAMYDEHLANDLLPNIKSTTVYVFIQVIHFNVMHKNKCK